MQWVQNKLKTENIVDKFNLKDFNKFKNLKTLNKNKSTWNFFNNEIRIIYEMKMYLLFLSLYENINIGLEVCDLRILK